MRAPSAVILFITILLLVPAAPAAADTIRVPADQPTIQAGIDAASDGDTVLVADGTYTGEGNRNIRFHGKAITVKSVYGPRDCMVDAYPEHVRVFVFDSSEGPDSVLEGFTITGGRGDIGEAEWGGGIYCEGSSPTIRGNIITGNTSCFGAGICCWTGSQLVIENNLITANQMQYTLDTGAWGGGIFVYQSDLTVIRDNVISGNIADLYANSSAIYGFDSTIEMTNNLVVNNGVINDPPFAAWDTVGLDMCQVTIRHLTLVDNDINSLSGRGALDLGSSTVTIENSIISNDFDTQIYLHESDCTVRYSDVRDGWAGEGNIDADPLFVAGPLGDHYLSHVDAGQAADSPCVDAGDPAAAIPGGTTRIDFVEDSGIVDMGYHYPAATDTRLVLGPGPGYDNPPLVRMVPPYQDAGFEYEFEAYDPDHYGVIVTTGDVTGDGRDDILTGAGPGVIFGPHVRGFEANGTPLPGLSFLAYGTPRWGVNVSAGDIDGDGFDEIVTGAGPGEVFGPHVRGWNYDGGGSVTPMAGVNYFAYGTPRWGVNVSAGDIDGDGYDEIVTGAGPGTVYGPHVRGWNYDNTTIAAITGVSFMAYGTNQYGVRVTCGDVDGDGIDEIVTAPGPGIVFGSHVRGWNFDGGTVTPLDGLSFMAWPYPGYRYGATVFAGADLDGDGRDDIVVGGGPDPEIGTPVRVYRYNGSQTSFWFSLEAYEEMTHGATVAAGRF
jgi:hypothetical protein